MLLRSLLVSVTGVRRMPGKKRKVGDDGGPVAGGKKNKCLTDWDATEWSSDASSKEGSRWSLKISSWNVDGLRACVGKGGAEFLAKESPDIMCFQETKVSQEKLPQEMKEIKDYPHCYWVAADKDGYSGVGET